MLEDYGISRQRLVREPYWIFLFSIHYHSNGSFVALFMIYLAFGAKGFLNACHNFARGLSLPLEKVIEAISIFVRSKQFSKATDGGGGGCHLDLTWNRRGSLFELAKICCKRIERVTSLKFLRRLLFEAGTGGVGMNFKPFAIQ